MEDTQHVPLNCFAGRKINRKLIFFPLPIDLRVREGEEDDTALPPNALFYVLDMK